MENINFLLFFLVSIPLLFTPGPDIIYIVTRGVIQGKKSSFIALFGVCIGHFCHVIFAVLGLSALIYSSELLFNIIKYLGAIYLIYLGIQALRSKGQFELSTNNSKMLNSYKIFASGILTSLINPKSFLFYFTFLPQFINVTNENIHLSLLILGSIFLLLCIFVYSIFAIFSSLIGNKLSNSQKTMNSIKNITGTIFITLGIRLVMPEQK
ncbi:LysE family translocator [Arcobacter sp. CECT 9188]|uniref:LysE family translocator n=1 Tax=Arcobacter sp. CECT 9188 TaxID=2044505 RepID=UPI000DEB7BF7|nr:LysE family translocator [Arcobacter sp. CECT 9188]RBQ27285.1 hypothetical protein CRU88_01090 [Arcobacter sp. CECT 9188]